MKKVLLPFLLLACALVISAFGHTDRNTPPQAVLTAFQQKFPAVTEVDWEREKDGSWEGEFDQGAVEKSASFTAAGVWLETETEIMVMELPPDARHYLAAKYKNKKIREAARIDRADGTTVFEAGVKGRGDWRFDASGKLLSIEKN